MRRQNLEMGLWCSNCIEHDLSSNANMLGWTKAGASEAEFVGVWGLGHVSFFEVSSKGFGDPSGVGSENDHDSTDVRLLPLLPSQHRSKVLGRQFRFHAPKTTSGTSSLRKTTYMSRAHKSILNGGEPTPLDHIGNIAKLDDDRSLSINDTVATKVEGKSPSGDTDIPLMMEKIQGKAALDTLLWYFRPLNFSTEMEGAEIP